MLCHATLYDAMDLSKRRTGHRFTRTMFQYLLSSPVHAPVFCTSLLHPFSMMACSTILYSLFKKHAYKHAMILIDSGTSTDVPSLHYPRLVRCSSRLRYHRTGQLHWSGLYATSTIGSTAMSSGTYRRSRRIRCSACGACSAVPYSTGHGR